MENIRLLSLSDEASYAEMWRTALVEQASFFRIALEDNPAQAIPTKFNADSFTLGVFVNGGLVGSVSLERDMRVKFSHKALLFKMFVHHSLAGRGVGRKLISHTLQAARHIEGLRQVCLTVLASNQRAIHLYTALGFRQFANEPEAVKMNESFVDELQMVYFLSENQRDAALLSPPGLKG